MAVPDQHPERSGSGHHAHHVLHNPQRDPRLCLHPDGSPRGIALPSPCGAHPVSVWFCPRPPRGCCTVSRPMNCNPETCFQPTIHGWEPAIYRTTSCPLSTWTGRCLHGHRFPHVQRGRTSQWSGLPTQPELGIGPTYLLQPNCYLRGNACVSIHNPGECAAGAPQNSRRVVFAPEAGCALGARVFSRKNWLMRV